MASSTNRARCLSSALLTITCAASISILYVYLKSNYAENPGYSREFSVQEKLTDETCIPVCDTKECVTFAKYLLSNMKPSVDPCENIHTFVCGAYEERVGRDESRIVHYDTENNAIRILNDIFRNIKADPESVSGKVKTMYDSCMNYVSTEKHALPTAQNFLTNIGIPDWPNLSPDFQFVDTDISTILGKLKASGEMLFVMFMVPNRECSYDYTPLNETHNVTVRLDIRYINKLSRVPEKTTIVHVLKFFDLDKESIEEIWKDYNSVRNSILNLTNENCRKIDSYCHLESMKYGQVPLRKGYSYKGACHQILFDKQEWYKEIYSDVCTKSNLTCSDNKDSTYMCKFFEVFLNDSNLNDRIKKDSITIDVGDEHFVTHIIPTLKNFTDRTVANFLALNYYLSHLEELNFYFQLTDKMYFANKECYFTWKLEDKVGRMGRWRVCTEWLANNMQFAAQYEFQKNYFPLEEHKKVKDLFGECKTELIKAMSYQDWLSENVKKKLKIENLSLVTLEHLEKYQSRPKEYEHIMNEFYKPFHPTVENFFHNAQELRRTISDIHLLSSPINKFLMSLTFENNAYFFAYLGCVIEFHLGPLVPTYYVPGLPRVLNLILFSKLGGHESGHYFDDILRYGEDNVTLSRIKSGVECLIKQYSQFKYKFADENLNGQQFISENFGDSIMGFLLDIFIEKYVSTKEEIMLPGFAYSFKETAYIVFNQMQCSKPSEKLEGFLKNLDNHPPGRVRAIGPMQNSRVFSEAFNCPEGSYMNPKTKCRFLDAKEEYYENILRRK